MNIYWEEHKNNGGLIGEATSFIKTPKNAGGYDITGGNGKENSIVFMMVKKPRRFHRMFVKLFLGWSWVDNDK